MRSDEPLLGLRSITNRVVDECVKRPNGSSRKLPIVVALGPRGTGKTALLQTIEDRCSDRVPFARLDLEEMSEARPREIVTSLAFDLSRDCRQFGRLAFPALTLCLLVVGNALNLQNRQEALGDLRSLLSRKQPMDKYGEDIGELVQLVGKFGLPGWAPSATDLLLRGLGWVERRRWLSSVRRLSQGQADPRDVLIDLKKKEQGKEDSQKAVDVTFCEAFLTDLRRAFVGGLNRSRRTANCVVLLDNIHTLSGRLFLDILTQLRRKAEGDPDPMVVIGTSRCWHPSWNAKWRRPGAAPAGNDARPAPRRPSDVDDDWRDSVPNESSPDFWYLVELGHLSEHDTIDVAAEHKVVLPHVPTFVHRLTDGHPWAVRRMFDEIVTLANPAEMPDLRELFAANGAIADEALDYLLQDLDSPTQRRDLITASAGRGIEFLSDSEILQSDMPDGESALHHALSNNLWLVYESDEKGSQYVLNPWLRRLLLLKLAARDDTSPIGWTQVHTRCRDLREKQGHSTDARYHDLALGDIAAVVAHLRAPFDSLTSPFDLETAKQWLKEFDAITAAPNRLPNQEDPRVQVEELIRDLEPIGSFEMAMPRLVAASWISNDPLGDPRNTLRPVIASAYEHLARRRGHGSILLFDRAEMYRQ
ncbi:MAG TPA: hypothetical protein VGX25_08665 [Actinophytocola sp.]|uniref:hypothetical protein n=1 Tax=Actinophytocola sp. TaxID=1872138 RepID=UPI002DDCBE22|nr:hypothetical protein [Actinophytocola sp.]HEV2779461.1 hypothetical protein [Actinophytocola sp.]